MAFYHLSLKPIQRGRGRSLIAAVSYRAGIEAESMYTGDKFDYKKKKWITHVNLILPGGSKEARPKFKDIGTFFNAVELAETARDARLAIELEIALPYEIPLEKQIELAEAFTRENFTGRGCAALVCLHWPPKHDDLGRALDAKGSPTEDISKMDFNSNPHIHLVIPARTMDENGKFESKSQIEYLCKRGSSAKAFTAAEFQEAKKNGWAKQYRYLDPDTKKKIWLTQDEAASKGLGSRDRTSKQPKTTPYGRKNPKVQYLSSSESLEMWRESWEILCNEKLKECGINERIDHRSLKGQGREDEIPSVHLGHGANLMKLRAERLAREGRNPNQTQKPDKQILSDRIKDYNQTVQAARGLDQIVNRKIAETREKLADIKHQKENLAKEKKALLPELLNLQRIADEAASEEERTKETLDLIEKLSRNALAAIDALEKELAGCPRLETARRKKILQKIETEKQKAADLRTYQSSLTKDTSGISSIQKHRILQKKAESIQTEIDFLEEKYQSLFDSVPEEWKPRLKKAEPVKSAELIHSK